MTGFQPAHFMGADGVVYAHGPHFWGGPLAIILFVLGIVAVIALLRFAFRGKCGPHRKGDEALSLLRARYAKGEIDEEEFDRRKQALG